MAEIGVSLSRNCTIRFKIKHTLPAKMNPGAVLPPFSTTELTKIRLAQPSPTAKSQTHQEEPIRPGQESTDEWVTEITMSEDEWFMSRRLRVLDIMKETERIMDPSKWSEVCIPIIQEYCAALDFYARKGSNDCVFWYWSPSNITVVSNHQAYADMMFEKANICFNVGTCEMRAADATLLSLIGASNASQSDSARTAYKFLCSAASWYHDGCTIMQEHVEKSMLQDPLKKPVVPDSTSYFFAAMRDLCLAEAQEIAYHRAEKAYGENSCHARGNDGLCSRLAARVAQLYENAEKNFALVPHQLVGKERSGQANEAGIPVLRLWVKVKKHAWHAVTYTLIARSVFGFGTELPANQRDITAGMKNIHMARQQMERAMQGLQDNIFSTASGTSAFVELCNSAERCWSHFRCIETFVNTVCDGLSRINESVYCLKAVDYQGPPETPKPQELAVMKKLDHTSFK